jgi:hypothetical protein
MNLQGNWLFRGYFEVSDPSGGPSITQQIRKSLAGRMGGSAASFRIASFPVGPVWRHTFWWREGDSDYAEAQFFARIAEEYPILTVGVSVEKGVEKPEAIASAKRTTFIMDRKIWDWQRLKNRAKDVLATDVPRCASLISRPVEIRFYTHRYDRGEVTTRERRAFVFQGGGWFERHKGKASVPTILDYVRDLDKREEWWVDAYFGCDLFPEEVEGMTADSLAGILSSFADIRRRIRPGAHPENARS